MFNVKLAKATAQQQQLPPEFRPDEGKKSYGNCYAYALILLTLDWTEMLTLPGFMSDSVDFESDDYWNDITSKNIISYVKRDVEMLGWNFTEDSFNNNIEKGMYRIAIYTNNKGFHFMRQNKDGSWSEKWGPSGEIIRVTREFLSGYMLLGVYRIFKKTE